MVEDTARQQQEGHKHLQEAHEFAEWSHKDQQERLPKLTPEQQAQMVRYLQLVEQHGWSKALEANNGKEADCEGCPVVGMAKVAKQAIMKGKSAAE